MSVLAVLSAGAWWWVTWPRRTALRFAAAMAMEDWASAKAMMSKVDNAGEFVPAWELLEPSQWQSANIRGGARTIRDIQEARQSFTIAEDWTMSVERDKVKMVGIQLILFRETRRKPFRRLTEMRPALKVTNSK
jgi:hypothetical protein